MRTIGKWRTDFMSDPGRVRRVTMPVRCGRYSARFEVQPFDRVEGIAGERAELVGMRDNWGVEIVESETSGEQFYTVSIYLPADWQPPLNANQWGIFLQLHGPDVFGMSPAIALSVVDTYQLQILTGDFDVPVDVTRLELQNNTLALGRWTDFVMRISYAKATTGAIELWRRDGGEFVRDLLVTDVSTLQYKSSYQDGAILKHYWRCGYYRSYQEAITSVIYLDCVSRGQTLDAVVAAAWN